MHGPLEVAVSGIAAKMVKVSAVLYKVSFVQQVHTAGAMGALASGDHELMVEVRLHFHHKAPYIRRLPRVSANSCGLY